MLVLQDLHTDVLWNLMLFSRQLRHLVRRRIASVLHDCKKRAIPEPDFPHLRLRRAGLIHHLRHRLHSWSGTFGRERGSRERPSHVLSAHMPHIGSICCVCWYIGDQLVSGTINNMLDAGPTAGTAWQISTTISK